MRKGLSGSRRRGLGACLGVACPPGWFREAIRLDGLTQLCLVFRFSSSLMPWTFKLMTGSPCRHLLRGCMGVVTLVDSWNGRKEIRLPPISPLLVE
jgi:hypothetical protein